MTEQERKEAVKLLEKIEKEFWSKDGIKWSRVETVDILPLIQQVRALFDKSDVKPRELTPEEKHFLEAKIAEPESSEFVKKCREWADPCNKAQTGNTLAEVRWRLKQACDRLEAAEKENKALRRPTEAAGFESDGLLAVGQELIDKDNKIKELQQQLTEAEAEQQQILNQWDIEIASWKKYSDKMRDEIKQLKAEIKRLEILKNDLETDLLRIDKHGKEKIQKTSSSD